MTPARLAAVVLGALSMLVGSAPVSTNAARSVAPEPGFTVVTYAQSGGTPTSLAFGKDTRDGAEGQRLYVTDNAGGTVLVIDDVAGAGGQPAVFAEGF